MTRDPIGPGLAVLWGSLADLAALACWRVVVAVLEWWAR
jgi:hypothetical protein